ncbi:hypothetical protein RUM44_007769 [Polyplax serrata]|uniref:Aminoacyl-tRNA synthetase class II (G/ P/ S/T) domain-containing protein n=1 Tax=Polyplax serrata TaxID=468196 RepID=A0ABR1B771_POLSC
MATAFTQPHIDLDKKFEEITKLKQNVERRKLQIDTVKLKSLWDFLKYLELTKLQLEKRKMEIVDHMKDLKKIGNDGEAKQEMEKLKVEGRIVREDLKTLLKAFWEVEEKVVLKGLSLPNELHKDTPDGQDKVVYEFKERPTTSQKESHLDVGQILGLIDFRDSSLFYLKNEAAHFELACLSYFSEGFKADDFIPFCNPDFSRSLVVEGCRRDHTDPNSAFTVSFPNEKIQANYRLHLVGGASMYPFCAFHTKHTISFSSLPLKYYTCGRQYSPTGPEQEDECSGLFGTWQRTGVEVFVLTADDYIEMMNVFRRSLDIVIGLYEQLGYHFRVTYVSASSLQCWECLRASVQMYSCHEQKYIEVGKISISDKYICQRLLMSYQMSEKDEKTRFMKMVSGTVVDVPKLLACILEQRNESEGKFTLPECLRYHSLA